MPAFEVSDGLSLYSGRYHFFERRSFKAARVFSVSAVSGIVSMLLRVSAQEVTGGIRAVNFEGLIRVKPVAVQISPVLYSRQGPI